MTHTLANSLTLPCSRFGVKQRKRPAGGVYKEPKRFVAAKKPVARPGTSGGAAGGAGAERAVGAAGDRTGPGVDGARIQRSVRASTKNKVRKKRVGQESGENGVLL